MGCSIATVPQSEKRRYVMDDRSLKAREMDPSTQPMAQRKRPHERITIGFLTAYIHDDVSRRLWRGVVDAADRHNINVVCFPGGGPYPQTEFEVQRSVIYELVNPAGLDGLISWSSI